MQFSATKNNPKKKLLVVFTAGWSLLLLASFLPSIPQPSSIIGYLWKTEFALALFLLTAIIFLYKISAEIQINKTEFNFIILPLLLFMLWSGISIFWAESVRNALHHTLLWGCYVVFYLLIRQMSAKPQFLDTSISIIGVVLIILGLACFLEYSATSAEFSGNVSLRFAKYAEAIAAIFVLFIPLALQKRRRNSIIFGVIAFIGWLTIIFSLSRTPFIAGLFGIIIFAAIIFFYKKNAISNPKAAIFIAAFLLITLVSQINFSANPNQTTLKRLSGDEHSQMSSRVRLLIWGTALESFKQNPLFGIGAENFSTDYETARKYYSQNNPADNNLALYEEILPERVHNEFLQILAELGIVGISIFIWFLFGILRLAFSALNKRISFLTIASFAGICAFLLSSMASSYSFRVPANGVCFFFVLAVFAGSVLKFQTSKAKESNHLQFTLPSAPIFAASIIVCFAMILFSAVRGTSLMYLQFALTNSEENQKELYFQKAIELDKTDPMIRYYYGLELYNSDKPNESLPHLQFAVENGISTSVAFFNLASAQTVAKQNDKAEKTFIDSLQTYPRSVFLYTAYASFLTENGETTKAEEYLKKAAEIDAAQARSWKIAFSEGMANLSQTEATDKQFVKTMELRPTEAIYALLDFQRQFRPNLVRR